jgi:hypothetical protein
MMRRPAVEQPDLRGKEPGTSRNQHSYNSKKEQKVLKDDADN